MDEKCLEQYYTYYECWLTSDIITLSQFYNFKNLGLKYHLPRLKSPVCPPPRPKPFSPNFFNLYISIIENLRNKKIGIMDKPSGFTFLDKLGGILKHSWICFLHKNVK